MGAWGILPFENDNALDNLALFENANWDGIYGMLMLGLESRNEDTIVMCAAIIDLIVNDFDKKTLGKDYKDTLTHSVLMRISNESSGDNNRIEILRREAYFQIDILIQSRSFDELPSPMTSEMVSTIPCSIVRHVHSATTPLGKPFGILANVMWSACGAGN